MAPRKASTTPERPAEALSLTNAIKRTTPWPAYSEVARWPRPGRMVIADMNGARPAASQRSAAYNERRRLLKACEAELFAAWEAGTTSWFGRVGSSSASYQVIPSSAARYVRINWRRLIACETVTGTVIFDIRIAPAEVATKAPRRQQQRAAAVVIRQSRARIIDALKASPPNRRTPRPSFARNAKNNSRLPGAISRWPGKRPSKPCHRLRAPGPRPAAVDNRHALRATIGSYSCGTSTTIIASEIVARSRLLGIFV